MVAFNKFAIVIITNVINCLGKHCPIALWSARSFVDFCYINHFIHIVSNEIKFMVDCCGDVHDVFDLSSQLLMYQALFLTHTAICLSLLNFTRISSLISIIDRVHALSCIWSF